MFLEGSGRNTATGIQSLMAAQSQLPAPRGREILGVGQAAANLQALWRCCGGPKPETRIAQVWMQSEYIRIIVQPLPSSHSFGHFGLVTTRNCVQVALHQLYQLCQSDNELDSLTPSDPSIKFSKG